MGYKAKILALRLLPAPLRRRIVHRRYHDEIARTGEAELTQLGKIVRPGELALDVGSNLGVYAHALSRITGRVIAFEPNPTLARFLESVFGKDVEVRQVALSSEDASAELCIPTDEGRGHGWASARPGFVEGEVERVQVPTRRLDSLDLPPVAFIKIDVEGLEEQVLDGAGATIARDRPVLLIEIAAADLESVANRLTPLGYQGAFLDQGRWRPLAEFDAGTMQNMERWREAVAHQPTRRELPFINNFLFLPPSRRLAELNA